MTNPNTTAGRALQYAEYAQYAATARSAAAAEPLANVRRKHLASATAWERLATTGQEIDNLRQRHMLEKLAAVAAGTPPAEPGLDPIALWA